MDVRLAGDGLFEPQAVVEDESSRIVLQDAELNRKPGLTGLLQDRVHTTTADSAALMVMMDHDLVQLDAVLFFGQGDYAHIDIRHLDDTKALGGEARFVPFALSILVPAKGLFNIVLEGRSFDLEDEFGVV